MDGDDANVNRDDNVNPYLELRAAKIARNEARLKELGLWKPKPKEKQSRRYDDDGDHSNNNAASAKKRKNVGTLENYLASYSDNHQYHPRRRSTRIKNHFKQPNYVEDKISVSSSRTHSSIVQGRTTRQSLASDAAGLAIESNEKRSGEHGSTVLLRKNRSPPSPSKHTSKSNSGSSSSSLRPNSARLISLDHGKLVQSLLGKNLEVTGKDHVVHESFRIAASVEDRNRLRCDNRQPLEDDDVGDVPRVSFNKYSGVQEWQNNVIFLWVNLNNPMNGSVENDFLDDGRQITWFGGSRMDDNSPIIQSLIRIGKRSTSSSSSSSSSSLSAVDEDNAVDGAIVLWCRKYDSDEKKFGPYYCFGRMGYHSHVVGSYPVKFVWNLLDFDALVERGGQDVRSMLMK